MLDLSKPGDDSGVLPDGLIPWRWCVVHTIRPELLCPLRGGEEYSVVARTVRRLRQSTGPVPTYRSLYERAASLAQMRATQLTPANSDHVLHTRMLSYGWTSSEASALASAWLELGVMALTNTEAKPTGRSVPTPDDLAAPNTGESVPPSRAHEIYTDTDIRQQHEESAIFLFSYGEYAQPCSGVDYRPYLERAERNALLHFQSCGIAAGSQDRRIGRREWFCATNPDIAVVHVYLETV